MKLHGEIVEIVENELNNINGVLVRVKIYDDDMIREEMNPDDPYIHLITQVSFWCNPDEIEDRMKQEIWGVWFNYMTTSKDRKDLVKLKTFKIDQETGEING